MQAEITSRGSGTLIGTSGEILLLTGSGTGAMEAAMVNVLSPGDRVVAVPVGGFRGAVRRDRRRLRCERRPPSGGLGAGGRPGASPATRR